MTFIAIPNDHPALHSLIVAVQELGLELNFYGHDENFSVVQITGLSRSYWSALKKVGVSE